MCIVGALGGFEYMEITDGQAVNGLGQFFDAAKDLTNFTATLEEKTPRSDRVAAKGHCDQRLPATARRRE